MSPLLATIAGVVGAFVVLRYLLRTPKDLPMRGKFIAIVSLSLAALSALLVLRAARDIKPGLAQARGALAQARGVVASTLASAISEVSGTALDAHVALLPGADSAVLREMPGEEASARERTVWTVATDTPPERVAAFYRDSAHRAGWTLELQAANGVVLRRAGRSADAGVQRLRILAAPAPAGSARRTVVEYELTRRLPRPAADDSVETAPLPSSGGMTDKLRESLAGIAAADSIRRAELEAAAGR
jgi:hypothetical protein